MPNGYHPVPGVQVVHISRTEQGYPRFEWSQSGSSFWAAGLVGGQASAPEGRLDYRWTGFDDLVGAVRQVIRAHWSPKDALGSAIVVDFERRSGRACGSFYAYGGARGRSRVVHDHSLLRGPRFRAVDVSDPLRLITTSHVSAAGLAMPPEETTEFGFSDSETLLVTSFPLHLEGHWPLEPLASAPSVALECDRGRDLLLALWDRPGKR